MSQPPQLVTDTPRRLRAPRVTNEGLQALVIHASVSLVMGTYVFVLALLHDVSPDITLGLFGTIVGAHVTAAAGAQVNKRRSDADG